MISTIIGGGIVSLPYAMYQFGLPLALCVNALVMTLVYKSVSCYLNLKDMIPD
jgi:amino acid permease